MLLRSGRVLGRRVALVTGSSSGIGAGVAVQLAKQGIAVCVHGREVEQGRELAERLRREHFPEGSARFYDDDLSDSEAVEGLIKRVEQDLGRLDILVNNAGVQHVCPIGEFPGDKYEFIQKVNTAAVFHATKAAFPGMKERHFGRIVNVASVHGLRSSPFKSAYVASKHAVVGLTKSIAQEGAPFNITCNVVCPGYVRTPLVDQQIASQMKHRGLTREEVEEQVFLGDHWVKEFVSAEEVGEVVAFLSRDSNRTLTGESIAIDAGWTTH